MEKHKIKNVHFKGVKIDDVGLADIIQIITDNRHKKGYVCVTEARGTMFAMKDAELSAAINESLLSIADGAPLAWYGRLLGCNRIERVAGFNLMAKMLERRNGFKHFLLGDTDQMQKRVMEKAREANEGLRISGYSPPFRHRFSEQENEAIIQKIIHEDPDLVWVSFGGGKQEKWMHQNVGKLPRGVMIGVGAAFRFYTGDLYIPPKIFQKLGMQWLFRIIQHPSSIPAAIRYRSVFAYYFVEEWLKKRKEKLGNVTDDDR